MKNFLNLNQLSMSWNEKQKPQRLRRYAVMLMMLLTLGVGQMWAWYNFGDNYGSTQVKIWFDNSSTHLQNVKIYFKHPSNDSYSVDYSFTQIAGTDYWEISTNYAGFEKFEIHGRPQNSDNDWGWKTNAKTDEIYSGWYTRCLSPSTTSGQAGSWTVPGLKNVSYTRNSTTTSNTLAGSGTSVSPYVIKPGTAIGVQLSGDLIDNNCTKYYKFGGGSATTTSTKQVVASAVKGTAYSMSAATGAKRDSYESRYASAGTLYFTTAYSISASVSGSHGSVNITSGGNYVYSGNTSFTVTASPDTGYEVDSWSVTGGTKSGSGNAISVTASGTADCSVSVSFKAKTYSITLDDNGDYQGNGSATIQRGDGSLTVSSHASRTGWNLVGYWTGSGSSGSQVTDAAGNLIASVSGYTDGSGNWIYDGNVSLYAHWNQINSLSVVAGSNISSVTGSTSPVTLGNKYDISATPNTGYQFSGWTASPAANATFDDASSASTKVTVKNGSVTVTGAATENMTTVTVNVSPAGAGTLTVASSSFTPGNTTTAGVTTSRTVVATANSGYTFLGWYKSGNTAGTSSTNTYTLKGNGSSGTGTLIAVFAANASSNWYLIGQPFGNNWNTSNHNYPLNLKYRGMSNVYMRVVAFGGGSNKYFKPLNNSTIYGQSSGSDVAVVTGTQYAITNTSSNGTAFKTNGQSTVWCIVDATNKKFWVQTPADYFPVTLSNGSSGNTLSSTEGTISLKTKNYGELATIYYALNESIKVAITAKSGYWIDDISINGSSVATDVNASSWDGWVTMPSANATLTVTYNRIYSLSYNANGGSGAAPATTYHISGTNATAAAASTFTARAYYTFGGWNTAQYITGTNYAAGASVPMTANTTLYAKWTRSVTLNQEDATTTGSTSVTGTYNCATLPAITNPEKIGYEFGGWYTEVAGGGNIIINTSGALQADKYHWTDASGRFDRTTEKAAADLYAKWTQTVTLNANTDNHGSGSSKTATVIYKKEALSSITHCTPATGYHLVGYYTDATGGTKVLNVDGTFASSAVTDYITDGKWTKAGATTLYAHYEANTYTIAFDPNDANYVGEATGTTASIDATYDESYTLTSNGFERAGYTFAGWATSATGAVTYTDGQTVSNLTSTNGGTKTLYAKWTPKTYTVTFNARGGSGLTPTSKDVTMGSAYGELATVTPPAGYVFDGWYTSAGGGTKVTSATQVTTAVDHTLYAHYIQKAQVYFKNTLGWSKVYVTYGSEWHGDQGAGNQGKTYHKMQLVPGTTDVYYDDIPDGILTSWQWNVAFDNTGFCADEYKDNPTTGTYYSFKSGEAVFRYDFDKKATMFVPTSNTGSTADGNYTKNGVQYRSTGYSSEESSGPKYTSGYWRTYNNTYSGYTMTYQKNTEGGTWHGGHKMESAKVGDNVFCFTVNMEANSQYNFSFYKNYNVNWKSIQFCYNPSTQINSSNCTNLQLDCNPNNSYMQTTVAGEYTFQLEMKADGHMYLSVIYPLAVGDFRVRYDYTKGSAKTYYSEIIKGRADGKDTISIFIHSKDSASSRSLTVEKCTDISSGTPTWNTSYQNVTSKLPAATTAGGKTSGVYDFIITQNGSKEIILDNFSYWKQYTGNYYIRTQCADGGWDFYRERSDNLMTLSEYSLTQTLSAPYSHYYCRFISDSEISTTDISYAVATDYSPNISGTMVGDATIGGDAVKVLPASANVRFSWNEETNALRRAYLKNAQTENARFLVLHGSDNKVLSATGSTISAKDDLQDNELKFTDIGNWVYQVELKAIPGAKVSLIANYNSADRYLVGDGDTKWETIIGGTGSSLYSIKAVYDFKTNRLMTAWIPGGEINENISDVDVLLLRYAQNAGTAITFGGAYTVGAKEVIGAIEMRYNDLVGHVANWTSSSRPLLKFFVSFPFDVNVSDIFGLNSAYGDAYIVEEYDGAGRAEKGFFGGDGTTTFWKELQPGDVMLANVGYCVILDNDYFNGDIGNIWDNKSAGSSVYLYFPSASSVGDIESSSETISIPEHLCHHDRTFITGGSREVNHINTDSHWNMMGVPIFDTHSDPGTSGQPGAVFATSGTDGDGNFNYFYEWNPSNNQFSIHTAVNYSFKCMHGYMVQYHGNVTFKTAAAPASVAARRAPQKENYQIELQVLNNNADVLNSAFVELRENACDTFELNEDVYMSFNNLAVNIYTLAGNYDVAANVLSVGNHTIPVGVKVTKAGTYTFSMPSNFSGTATLVDSFTGERTNLALDDYEVNLQKGVIEDRFLLEIDVQKVATAIDGASGEGSLKDGKAHKFLQNNTLYILQNGVLYDARGARVQ